MQSPPCISPSVHLSVSTVFFNRVIFGLDLLHVCGSLVSLYHDSQGTETKGYRLRSRCGQSDRDPRLKVVF